MNFDNLPQDEASRRLLIKAEKETLSELVELFQSESVISPFILETLSNKISRLDDCLEFGVDHVKAEQYEADAKADNRTDI